MPDRMVNDFSGGWRPSDDSWIAVFTPVTTKNLKLDEIGGLTLVPGSVKCNTAQFANTPHSVYSKTLGT